LGETAEKLFDAFHGTGSLKERGINPGAHLGL
jgi:hypothetical protein